MKIVIESIPHKNQRYDTLGDWWFDDDGTLQIRVSEDETSHPTEYHQFLVALHELVEVQLCKMRGISQKQVDDYDIGGQDYFKENGLEPGDQPDAPYRREHRFAMLIEHLMAHELGISGYGRVE